VAVSALAGALVACLALTGTAAAETLRVNTRDDHSNGFCTPQDCTLREAVGTINASPEVGGKVILPSRRPYELDTPGEDEFNAVGDLDVYGGPQTIVHPGRGRATIDAGDLDRVIETFDRVTLKNLVITGGFTPNYGGGVRAFDALKLINTVVRGNDATQCGGGIHMQDNDRPLTIQRSKVIGNFGNQGGGISASCFGGTGPVTITGSTIARNNGDADGNLNGYGGGIYLQTNSGVRSTIANSTFLRNTSGLGGTGAAAGGGIYSDLGRLRLTGSTIAENRAGDQGGGLYISGTMPAQIVNSTFSGNRANSNGGGIHLDSGAVSLNAVTVVRNRGNADGIFSEAGGGISTEDDPFHVSNSLIALNTLTALSPGDPPVENDCAGADPFISQGHNLLSTFFICDGFDDASDRARANPKIGRLARNGGPTQTVALKKGSPAIGKADRPSAPARDQRGRKRDERPDIGAFER
jgi:CSLREA domain-containing protein